MSRRSFILFAVVAAATNVLVGCEPRVARVPTEARDVATCTPALIEIDAGAEIWFGHEPHDESQLIGVLCAEALPGVSAAQKQQFSDWLRSDPGDYTGQPGSKLRICGMEESWVEPSRDLAAEASRRIPGIMDWCWILGPADLP